MSNGGLSDCFRSGKEYGKSKTIALISDCFILCFRIGYSLVYTNSQETLTNFTVIQNFSVVLRSTAVTACLIVFARWRQLHKNGRPSRWDTFLVLHVV